MNESSITLQNVAAWLDEYDLPSKQEGWLITNDSDYRHCIAKIDDPPAWIEDGWPLGFTEPKFQSDEDAVEFVRGRAAAGSHWHAEAIAIHDARLRVPFRYPEASSPSNEPSGKRPLHEQILKRCSAGPWHHGLHLPAFSADSQPCVYGDERELPLAMLDEDDVEASANVVLLAAAWELCRELGLLVDAALAAIPQKVPGTACVELRERCNSSLALFSRICSDVQNSVAERHGEEDTDE